MNIQNYRASFTVSVVNSNLQDSKIVSDVLENSGYSVLHYMSEENFESDFKVNIPHILILSYENLMKMKPMHADEWIENLLHKLPELHIIILAARDKLDVACDLFESGVYDVLEWPNKNTRQLLRAADRAAETDYHVYLNEELKEKLGEQTIQRGEASYSLLAVWLHELYKRKDSNFALMHLMNEISRYLSGAEVLFFKYIPNRSMLVAQNSVGLEMRLLENIGIDLKSTEKPFNESLLLKPQSLRGLQDLVVNGFRKKHYAAFPIISGREVRGVLVAIPKEHQGDVVSDPYIRVCLEAHHHFERLMVLQGRLQKTSLLDDQTEVFNRDFILKKVKEEISRARRILKPVSILLLSLDKFQEFQLSQPQAEVDKLLKSVGGLFTRNSRLNDLVGRVEVDQFILVLPHTDKKGAAIKAERLRRMIESADFSKILNQPVSFTVSIGVSDYPSVCHDADSLLETAEEALYQIRKNGDNKVCLATPKGSFVADFEIKEEK
ncbi:MAG: GGDEF domain-containing protein [Bdellovibrionota bacterium]